MSECTSYSTLCRSQPHTSPTRHAGLQVSKQLSVDQTVEGVLERALLHAGFIAPSNYGDLFKVRCGKAQPMQRHITMLLLLLLVVSLSLVTQHSH